METNKNPKENKRIVKNTTDSRNQSNQTKIPKKSKNRGKILLTVDISPNKQKLKINLKIVNKYY